MSTIVTGLVSLTEKPTSPLRLTKLDKQRESNLVFYAQSTITEGKENGGGLLGSKAAHQSVVMQNYWQRMRKDWANQRDGLFQFLSMSVSRSGISPVCDRRLGEWTTDEWLIENREPLHDVSQHN